MAEASYDHDDAGRTCRWRRLEHVFAPDGRCEWMHSHASNPVAEHVEGDLFRVYFSPRDADNRSHVGWIEIDITKPGEVLRVAEQPVLAPGEVGRFDDSGVSVGCLVRADDGATLLYYVGWNLGVTVPWRNTIGLAVRHPGETVFERFSRAPVLGRHEVDPYSLSYPWVLREDDRWRMWYGSNLTWGASVEDMTHVVRYAESADGVTWTRSGEIAVDLADETAISRPCVIRDGAIYRMWYSYRGDRYRIGYAESPDGIRWTRRDSIGGLEPSRAGWDSEMVEYPFVFDHEGRRYMLYNGNGYGRSGIGLAVQKTLTTESK